MPAAKQKVCLITPGHISSNPRLVKEATALEGAGYAVHLVFTQYLKGLAANDEKILQQHPAWTYAALDWTDRHFRGRLVRYISGLQQKAVGVLARNALKGKPAYYRLNRHFRWQLNEAVKAKAQLYIGHNLAAAPVAYLAARRTGARSGFDAEDFHRHDVSDDPAHADVQLKAALEEQFYPRVDYRTTASPLISAAYRELFPSVGFQTVLNAFPLTPALPPVTEPGPVIRLFWFSQNIGLNRGVQDVIRAMKQVEDLAFEFHLYGYLPAESRDVFAALVKELGFQKPPVIRFHPTVAEAQLLNEAASYDIGFAIEPGFCINNRIALSNKLFTYLFGGNAVVVSDTPAQAQFHRQYPGVGSLYAPGDSEALAQILRRYATDRKLLLQHKQNARALFETELNWQNESRKWLELVKEVLQ